MKYLLYRDYGVKGMKKGVRHEEPNQGSMSSGKPRGPRTEEQKAITATKKRLKKAGVALGQKRGLWSRLKEGYKVNREIGRQLKEQGHGVRAALGFNPLAAANNAAFTASAISNFEKRNKLGDSMKRKRKDSMRKYRDSQRKLAIAKRQYRDALRRYRDAEENTLKAKFNAIMVKIKNTIKEYIKAFPTLSRLLSLVLVIDSIGNTYGVVAGAPKVIKGFDKIFKEIDNVDLSSYGKAGLKVRGVLYALFIALKQVVKAIIKFKAAKGIAGVLNEK